YARNRNSLSQERCCIGRSCRSCESILILGSGDLEDRSRRRPGYAALRDDLCILMGEAISLDGFVELVHGRHVTRRELDGNKASVQIDVYVVDARDAFH